jgi:hypothetical protein
MPENIIDLSISHLFWLTLTGMLPGLTNITLSDVLCWIILPNSTYVLVACVCRVRFGTGTDISTSWAGLYLGVAAVTVLVTLSALYGQARVVDALLATIMSAYIHMTAPAWRSAVPALAAVKTPKARHDGQGQGA